MSNGNKKKKASVDAKGKLALSRETVQNLNVKTSMRAGDTSYASGCHSCNCQTSGVVCGAAF